MRRQRQDDAMLRDAMNLLTGRGAIAFAWVDEHFISRWSFGELAHWIRSDETICAQSAPLAGMETRLRALQDDPETSLLIPNIGTGTGNAPDRKVSIQAFWSEEMQNYLVVTYELGPQAEIDRDVFKQLKARRLAEENFRKAREELTEKQHHLDVLIAHAPAAVAMLDHELRYQLVTQHWSREFGVELEPIVGRRHDEVFPTSCEPLRRSCRESREGRSVHTGVEAVRRADGKKQWVRWDIQPWHRRGAHVGGIVVSGDIVTELIETQQQLEARNAELADLNGDLNEFTSIVAHDLQAPIRSLQGTAEAIRAQSDGLPELNGLARELTQTIKRMRTMIYDLHEYSRARHRSRVVRHTDIGELVGEIAASLSGANGFEVTFTGVDGSHPFPVASLDLVLRNLIDNALKHHDRETGRIDVSLREGESEWVFTVSDDGPGIAPGDQSRVFRPFVTASADVAMSGSGMGLALVRKTIEAHGGTIEIQSAPAEARGTRFVFSWPKADSGTSEH
ncbi:MAG: sensor histidine kinase [Dichotomicrobium sp.]